MKKKLAVVLCGCGVKDGSEIHESVVTILQIWKAGAEPLFFAPRGKQPNVINHLTGEVLAESRDMLVESARIARGAIRPLDSLRVEDADGLIFPGGIGASTNLCDFAKSGSDCSVLPEVERSVLAFFEAKKPIGAICIAPVIIAKVLGKQGVSVTVGSDQVVARKISAMGARHVNCAVDEIEYDEAHRIVSTPAYMLAKNPAELESGIARLVQKVLELVI